MHAHCIAHIGLLHIGAINRKSLGLYCQVVTVCRMSPLTNCPGRLQSCRVIFKFNTNSLGSVNHTCTHYVISVYFTFTLDEVGLR